MSSTCKNWCWHGHGMGPADHNPNNPVLSCQNPLPFRRAKCQSNHQAGYGPNLVPTKKLNIHKTFKPAGLPQNRQKWNHNERTSTRKGEGCGPMDLYNLQNLYIFLYSNIIILYKSSPGGLKSILPISTLLRSLESTCANPRNLDLKPASMMMILNHHLNF